MEAYQLLLVSLLIFAGGVEGKSGGCNGQPKVISVSSSIKMISSANYPSNYDNNMECIWILKTTSPGSQIEAYFLPMVTEECCDYLEIRDGDSATSTIVAKWRGNITSPLNVISTYGALYIRFVSDETITAKGFRFQYRRAPTPTVRCGGSLTASSQLKHISSPNFPSLNYPDQAYCVWIITAPPGKQVQITVWYYELESCCDNLLIRDGTTKKAISLAYRRGRSQKSTSYNSTGGVLHVRFRSDATFNFRGFNASYKYIISSDVPTSVPEIEECGGDLEVPSTGIGYASTPGYGIAHPSNVMCVWIISTTLGQRVRVWFSFIHTEQCCDWIKIRDGSKANSPKIGLISGNPQHFSSYVSTGNVIRVEFDSDHSTNGIGVNFYYENYNHGGNEQTSCGSALIATPTIKYFSTPNWPDQYDNNTSCTWIITAKQNEIVYLLLLGAITEKGFDYIKVYEGANPGQLIGRLTGKYINRLRAISRGRQLTIVFESNGSTSAGGFRASYRSLPNKLAGLFGK